MDTTSVENRYNALAGENCCLSCGNAMLHAGASEGEICMDLGSGRGTDVMRLAGEVGPSGFVYGVDVADAMLEKAKNSAAKLGLQNVQFLKSTLESIPIPGGIIDLIISNCTINHAQDKQAVWNEIFRLLKKGGRFVVSDIFSIGDVPEVYRNDPRAVAECWAGAVSREIYLETVRMAGFENLQILEESTPYEKGKIHVASFTLAARKPAGCSCCS
jgi:ubiquinone/menaquinone biosynthesis C-methylase UbiE